MKHLLLYSLLIFYCATLNAKDAFIPLDESNEHAQRILSALSDEIFHPNVRSSAGKYIVLGDDSYLYIDDGAPISAGLYFLNVANKKRIRVVAGLVAPVLLQRTMNNHLQFITSSIAGRRGMGSTSYTLLEISPQGETSTKKLVAYSWDMVSGLCGRKELGLKVAGEISKPSISYTEKGAVVAFDVEEQNCATNEIEKKSLNFTVDK